VPPHADGGRTTLGGGPVEGDAEGVERIVATYFIDGHEVDVVEMLDDGGAWFELAIDGAILPDGDSFTAAPNETTIVDVLHRWHATAA
jgi:hypothetical protein